MLEKPLFPTMFYETHISHDLCFSVLNEIKSKQSQIDMISEATQIQPVSDYSTDFMHSIRIETFWNDVVPTLQNEMRKINFRMENIQPWVACYTGPCGYHPIHNHEHGYDGRLHYSAILYLTSVGTTDFFTMGSSAHQYRHSEASQLGKVIFFPSILPHQYRSDHFDGNARYVLPFNCELFRCEN